MRRRESAFLLAAAALACPLLAQGPQTEDAVIRAMRAEIDRSRELRVVNLEGPYYIEYALDNAESFSVSATLGAVIRKQSRPFRSPRVHVRVGDYKFDNTNYVFADFFTGRRGAAGSWPLDNDEQAMRHYLWLQTDQAYKGAVEGIARKRAALRNVTVAEDTPDFERTAPLQLLLPVQVRPVDESLWTSRVRALSAVFAQYPKVFSSRVEFESVQSASYLVNSEGTAVRIPETLAFLRIRAWSQADDGMPVRSAAAIQALQLDALPSEQELRRRAVEVAENVTALVSAPVGEPYAGPVLVEPAAAAQIFAEVLGANLAVARRPVAEPGRSLPFLASELEGRIGSRILPDWMDVVDDPTQKEWRGRPLIGHFFADLEGVKPEPVQLVEKGVLKSVLRTRQPVKGLPGSNGRARLPGSFGAKAATFSNLFVRATETMPLAGMKTRLIELANQRNKPYGLIVRATDFPSSANPDDLRRLASGMRQSGSRPVSEPLLVYRVYPDGREELVRGMRFRSLTVRSLRDIIAASEELHLVDFLVNQAPFSWMDGGSYVTPCAVVAPAVLFEDLDLERPQEELPRSPVVPPPPLSVSN